MNARPREEEKKRPVILYSHGNAEDLNDRQGMNGYASTLGIFADADVFCYEYVGYSLSRLQGDKASEEGCYRSIDAAWKYLVEHLKIEQNRIVIFGFSLGP